jgi:hypothetical protein
LSSLKDFNYDKDKMITTLKLFNKHKTLNFETSNNWINLIRNEDIIKKQEIADEIFGNYYDTPTGRVYFTSSIKKF